MVNSSLLGPAAPADDCATAIALRPFCPDRLVVLNGRQGQRPHGATIAVLLLLSAIAPLLAEVT